MKRVTCCWGEEYKKSCVGFCGDIDDPYFRCRYFVLVDDDLKICEGQTTVEPFIKEELKEMREKILKLLNIPPERYSDPNAAVAEAEAAYLETIKRFQQEGK